MKNVNIKINIEDSFSKALFDCLPKEKQELLLTRIKETICSDIVYYVIHRNGSYLLYKDELIANITIENRKTKLFSIIKVENIELYSQTELTICENFDGVGVGYVNVNLLDENDIKDLECVRSNIALLYKEEQKQINKICEIVKGEITE